MIGKIHSFESFGTVDGPGLRYVVFMQGCPLRCKYCHNPDTWEIGRSKLERTPEELFAEIKKYEAFFSRTGGITVSGGEPLVQAPFILEFFKLCKEAGYHTALDTSGYVFNDTAKEVFKYSDLVLLDIKSIVPEMFKDLTSIPIENTLKMANYLSENGNHMWIRHVLVPGYTENDNDLHKLAEYVSKLKNVDKVEVLPYHKMGIYKWETLGIDYPLEGVETPTKERVENARNIFREYGIIVQ